MKPDTFREFGNVRIDPFFWLKDKTNPEVKNSMIYMAPLAGFQDMKNWEILVPHDPKVKIQGFSVYKSFLGLFVRANGLNQIRILKPASGEIKEVIFPEPVYTVSPMEPADYATKSFRYSYSSLNRPQTIFEFDVETAASKVLKVQEIPGGFDSGNYTVERLWADARDGTKVPMAVIYRKDLVKDGNNPALLYAYGSYGYSTDAYFNSSVFSLIDRGFVYGIAQIRGGSEMGEQWYEDGKMMKKMNTFTDFIACADHLVKEKYTSPALSGNEVNLQSGIVFILNRPFTKYFPFQHPGHIHTAFTRSLVLNMAGKKLPASRKPYSGGFHSNRSVWTGIRNQLKGGAPD